MTLGSADKAHLALIVWSKDCRDHTEPDPAEMAERYELAATADAGGGSARTVSGQNGTFREQNL